MSEIERHEMLLEQRFPSGAEEWSCTACARRFVVQWPPKYRKIILEAGDEHIAHSGKSQLEQPSQLEADEAPNLSDEWHSAFDELDFGDWPEGFE